jgi:hypothetical protein
MVAYVGISKRPGRCAICKKDFPTGAMVCHDPLKREGVHLAHKGCFDELMAKRGWFKKKHERLPVLSTEELDPPF